MEVRKRISDKLTVSMAPPAEDELARLASEGFGSVVDLRREGEPNQALQPSEEAEVARRNDLLYLNLPVDGTNIDQQTIDRFRAAVSSLRGQVLVHCASGRRAEKLALAMADLDSA